jgi:5S rRNA maturation endonuclease (ribonuclease M5)
VEGYFDVLALHGHGFPHAVAASGTALSSEHLRLLRKFCSRLIVLFDGDRAGQDAMERAMTTGLKEGWILEGAKLPQGLDPDELTRQSPEELRKILESARPLLDSKLEELAEEIRQNPTSESRVRALKQASEYLRELQDPLGQEVRTAWIAENFGIDRRTIQNAMGVGMLQVVGTKGILAGAPKTLAPQGSPSRSSQRQKSREKLSRRERWLLWGVLKGGEMSRSLERAMELGLPPSAELESLFVHSETREWLRRWRKRAESSSSEEMSPGIKKKGPNLGILSKITALLQSSSDEVLNGVEDAEMRAILTQGLLGGEVAGTPSSQELYAAGVEAVRQVWARFSQHLKKKLQEAEAIGDPDRRASAMKDYLDVQRKLKDFNDSSEIHYD